MTTDWKALCAELVDELHGYASANPHHDSDELVARTRTLLDQPVAEGPTDEELEDLADVMTVSGDSVPAMRRALELWGRPTPQPPAAGEVAELVEWLRRTGKLLHPDYSSSQVPYMRAAELLLQHHHLLGLCAKELDCLMEQHQHPQPVAEGPTDEDLEDIAEVMTVGGDPVPAMRRALELWGNSQGILDSWHQPVAVSERLPGPEDCTEQGWCWVFYRGFATWTLEPPLDQDGKHTGYTHWLPANALPTPEANAQ